MYNIKYVMEDMIGIRKGVQTSEIKYKKSDVRCALSNMKGVNFGNLIDDGRSTD